MLRYTAYPKIRQVGRISFYKHVDSLSTLPVRVIIKLIIVWHSPVCLHLDKTQHVINIIRRLRSSSCRAARSRNLLSVLDHKAEM